MADYTLQREQRSLRVKVQGDLTAAIVPPLQASLLAELKTDTDEVVFDLASTRMVDSTGIGLLIAAANSLSGQKGAVRLRNVSRDLVRLFQSMRLTRRLDVQGPPTEAGHG